LQSARLVAAVAELGSLGRSIAMNPIHLELKTFGSHEGTEYQFMGDADSFRQLAYRILARLDEGEPRPWPHDSSVIVAEEITPKVFLCFRISDA
jgi:hypothetical protein